MRNYIYKIIIFAFAIVIVFEFTLGKYINKFNQQLDIFTTAEGRKEIVSSIKKETPKPRTRTDIDSKAIMTEAFT